MDCGVIDKVKGQLDGRLRIRILGTVIILGRDTQQPVYTQSGNADDDDSSGGFREMRTRVGGDGGDPRACR